MHGFCDEICVEADRRLVIKNKKTSSVSFINRLKWNLLAHPTIDNKHLIFEQFIMADPIASTVPNMKEENVDMMRSGLNSHNFAAAAKQLHPVDRMQRGKEQINLKALHNHLFPNLFIIMGLFSNLFFLSMSLCNTTRGFLESAGSSGLDLDAIRRLYGSGLAMRLATERSMAQKVGGRLTGYNGSRNNIMLESLTGDDMNIEFGDYLNLEQNRPFESLSGNDANLGIHAVMETKLNL